MNTFRTEIIPAPSRFRISHESTILLNGSCFTDNIGQKLRELSFKAEINPFGVIYNPLSLLNSLGILLDGGKFTGKDLNFHNDLWFSWDHHSSFSNPNKKDCLSKINEQIHVSSSFLKKADFLFLTFGTAWVYRLKINGEIVNNCHKFPESEFDRIFLGPNDIENSWKSFIPEILKINKNLKIIFTVSPVRHWKDGAHGNQLSKSALLLAIDKLCSIFPDNTEYFPAYELLLDDLRDYRFYADDLFHPNTQAVNYIWSVFGDVYFDKQTQEINKELGKLNQAKNHRVFNEGTDAFRKFKEKLLKQTQQLNKKYPFLEINGIKPQGNPGPFFSRQASGN